MPSKRTKGSKKSKKGSGASGKKSKKEDTLHICTDFDNTLVSTNTAGLLIQHYVLHGKDALWRRLRKAVLLAVPGLRRTHFPTYYDMLRKVPVRTRRKILEDVGLNEAWLREVRRLRLHHKKRYVDVTILTRNCIDVVDDWLGKHEDDLAEHGITVETVIANGPLDADGMTVVKEDERRHHVDYVGFGQLREQDKKEFVTDRTIYVGDTHEGWLRPLVKEFIRV